MKTLQNGLAVLASLSSTIASPLLTSRSGTLPLSTRTIFQFNESGTWLENIAVRPNGDILMTMMAPTASVYTIKQPYSPSWETSLVYEFDATIANGTLGIAETTPDAFILVGALFSSLAAPIPGTSSVWELSFDGSTPNPRKVVDIPGAGILNGISVLPTSSSDTVLIADSRLGSVWRLDTRSGEIDTAIQVSEMQPAPDAAIPVGINGLKVRDGYLYWTNGNLATIFRVRIESEGYPLADAELEKVAVLDAVYLDDFVFDEEGTMWVTSDFDNKLFAVRSDGTSELVVGGANDATIGGDTSAAFGRTEQDRDILYVVTGGELAAPINGTQTEPAKVIAVDIRGFH